MTESHVDLSRKVVFQMEKELLKLPQIELPVFHHFAKGVCARELHIPADTVLTGAVHLHDNLNFLLQGTISVLTDKGMEILSAPATVVSPAGTKRIAYAHTDCIWTTIFGTDEKDVDKIISQFTSNDELEYLELKNEILIEVDRSWQ